MTNSIKANKGIQSLKIYRFQQPYKVAQIIYEERGHNWQVSIQWTTTSEVSSANKCNHVKKSAIGLCEYITYQRNFVTSE
jgi:hypothetical protein